MDGIKLFAKNKKRIGNLNTSSEKIQSRYRDGIWHRKMGDANHKQQMTEGIELPKQKKNQTPHPEKRKLTDRNIGGGHHQTSRDERKKLKRVPQKNEKSTRNQTT